MQKIGVFGAGHLGKIHIKCIRLAAEAFELVGFYDPNPNIAQQVEADLGVKAFSSPEALLAEIDIADIVTPTVYHFEVAAAAIKAGKHVFIEKPVTQTVEEARELMVLADQHQRKVQVGHVERFNPALLALEDMAIAPRFIEAHRLATFNPRGTDVSVVLDLMIHDLDIILSMVDSPVTAVHANGVSVVSPSPDIANARVEFENGCVANLTASRLSLKQMRKVRFFQPDAYVSLDFLEKKSQVVRLMEPGDSQPEQGIQMELSTPKGDKILHIAEPPIEPVNAIKMELETFANAIENDARPVVSLEDGYRALEVAERINEQIRKNKDVADQS